MTNSTPPSGPLERSFSLTRTIHAPRESVYRAWTDPEQLGWFFADPAADNPPTEVDLRVGGQWRLLMVVDEDTQYMTGGVYREIVPGERIVFTWGAVDGWPTITVDDPQSGPEVTVEFADAGEGTLLTLTHRFPAWQSDDEVAEQLAMGMRQGWDITVDRLVEQYATS